MVLTFGLPEWVSDIFNHSWIFFRHFSSKSCTTKTLGGSTGFGHGARPGFNIQCNDGNWARWGYCNNVVSQGCHGDDDDADASIGIGLHGQSTDPPEMGAGYTYYFSYDNGAYGPVSKSVWLWVKNATCQGKNM